MSFRYGWGDTPEADGADVDQRRAKAIAGCGQ